MNTINLVIIISVIALAIMSISFTIMVTAIIKHQQGMLEKFGTTNFNEIVKTQHKAK